MSRPLDAGLDEPTVVGHRPAALRGAAPRGGPGAAPSPSSDPRRARAAAMGNQAPPDAAAGSAQTRVPTGPRPTSVVEAASDERRTLPVTVEQPTGSENALVAAATPLLVIVPQLREATDIANPEALRREITEQIKRFDENAVKFGARGSDVSAARYVLCSLLDEAVMTTPWGSASNWSANSLLNQFHNETWGGEKVFSILDRVRNEPRKYLALIKLIDMALSLGFEGMYRVLENGRERLSDIRDELGRIIAAHDDPKPEALSKHWKGLTEAQRLRNYVPIWVVFAVVGVVLVVFYGVQQYRLSLALEPIQTRLETLGVQPKP